jgi:hypothetical protein
MVPVRVVKGVGVAVDMVHAMNVAVISRMVLAIIEPIDGAAYQQGVERGQQHGAGRRGGAGQRGSPAVWPAAWWSCGARVMACGAEIARVGGVGDRGTAGVVRIVNMADIGGVVLRISVPIHGTGHGAAAWCW